MNINEYVEMKYLHRRWKLLSDKFDRSGDIDNLPEVEVALKEICDIGSLIDSLRSIERVYGRQ